MAERRIESSKQRLLEKINEGKLYLQKDELDPDELLRLKKNLEKKKLQFEKDLESYENSEIKNQEKEQEYQNFTVEAEDLFDDLEHYENISRKKKEEEYLQKKQEAEAEEKKFEREASEREKDRQFQLERGRLELESEERRLKIAMEEKINLEKLQYETKKIETENINEIKQRQLTVKLPKLDLKKFDGNILKWTEFWDAFEATIHKNESLHEVDKFNYLKSQLQGQAIELLSGLELTKDNYEIAVNLLKERYGKKQIMIDAHYAKMMNLPLANHRSYSLRVFYDTTEKHLRCLKSLGEDDNQKQLLTMMKSKIPRSILFDLEKMKPEGEE